MDSLELESQELVPQNPALTFFQNSIESETADDSATTILLSAEETPSRARVALPPLNSDTDCACE